MTPEGPESGATLYRLWDGRGRLLYVGITARGMRRVFEHARSKPWWSEVSTQTIHHCATYEEAAKRERIAIAVERPRYNKRDTYHWTRRGAYAALGHLGIYCVVAVLGLILHLASTMQSFAALFEASPFYALCLALISAGYAINLAYLLKCPIGRELPPSGIATLLAFAAASTFLQAETRLAMFDDEMPAWLLFEIWVACAYAIPILLVFIWHRRDSVYLYIVRSGGLVRRRNRPDPHLRVAMRGSGATFPQKSTRPSLAP